CNFLLHLKQKTIRFSSNDLKIIIKILVIDFCNKELLSSPFILINYTYIRTSRITMLPINNMYLFNFQCYSYCKHCNYLKYIKKIIKILVIYFCNKELLSSPFILINYSFIRTSRNTMLPINNMYLFNFQCLYYCKHCNYL